MAFEWRLEEILRIKGIKNANQLKATIGAELGIVLSRQSLHKLISKEPQEIRISTIQVICNLLQVSSDELFTVTPEPKLKPGQASQKLYKKKPKSNSLTSNPREFLK